jgi:hypothetical protein
MLRAFLYTATTLFPFRAWLIPMAALAVAGNAVCAPPSPGTAPHTAAVERLQQALAPLHARYDPKEQMLREPFSSPGYHTALKGGYIHSTRSSLNYAVALLDTGDAALRSRAEAILTRVIGLQDQDPASKTYGIWSWFLEEPLDKMSPPDWNWADFCGTALLQVAVYHSNDVSPEVLKKVKTAVEHAAASIRKRNVGPGYTNIAIMGTYVTLVAGELFGLADLRDYALERWRRFYEYTMKNGGFSEYNSPTYTIVALKELARLRQHARSPEALRLTEEIYRMAWKDIAAHFHAPTRQWAGPHSRCYQTLLTAEPLDLIQRATDGRVAFGVNRPALDELRLQVPCPPDLEPAFTQLQERREFRQTFIKAEPPVIGTTVLDPQFTLGSVSRGDLWNQRRPLLAYFGTAEKPGYLRVRFLHDDYDFAAAQFFSVQEGGRVLAAINFATDGGDRHPSLDRIKGETITAKDLRLRFEFGGSAAGMELAEPKSLSESARVQAAKTPFELSVPWARWGSGNGKWQSGKDTEKGLAFLDVVLYSGEAKAFRMAELEHAAVALCVSANEQPVSASAQISGNVLKASADSLWLEIPVRPGAQGVLQKSFRAPSPGH